MSRSTAVGAYPAPIFHRGTKARPFFSRSVERFKLWLDRAAPGDWCCYFEGDLRASREAPSLRLSAEKAEWLMRTANQIGEAAWDAYKAGKVELFQQRHILFGFRYFAVRTHYKARSYGNPHLPRKLRSPSSVSQKPTPPTIPAIQ